MVPDVIFPRTKEEKEYATGQKSRMNCYKVGELDIAGNKITKILTRGDDFLVYEIEGLSESESFKVIVDTMIDSDPNGYIKRYEKIKPSIDDFRSILHKGVHDKSVKNRAASAISTAMRGDVDGAKAIFIKIREQVEQEHRTISNGRFNYLGSSFVAMLILAIVAAVLYGCRRTEFIVSNALFKQFCYAASFAALGGFLSVCINLKDIQFERSLETWMYQAYGIQRIILAACCGIVAYLAVASDVLFSFLMKSPNAGLALMVVCVLSGFSEKLIPNALRKLETKED